MFQIKTNQNQLQRILSATDRVLRKATSEKKSLPMRNAYDFKSLLIMNILNQKYAGQYAAYHPMYKKWKKDRVGHLKYWQLDGDLLRAMSVWPFGKNGVKAGIPKGILDSGDKSFGKGHKSYIGAYATMMEKGFSGSQKHPKRELFGPTTEEYRKNGFKNRGHASLKTIGNMWR